MVSSLPCMVSWLPSLHHCAAILFDENKSCGNRFLSSRSMLNPVSRFGGLKVRVVAFVLAMAAMVALIVWTGHSTWRRTGELRERLTAVQLKSFQIADKLQESIWELKNIVFRYGVYHSTNDWARFERLSSELDRWIDEQRPILSTEQEKLIVDQINTSYDGFMAAARQIQSKARLESE